MKLFNKLFFLVATIAFMSFSYQETNNQEQQINVESIIASGEVGCVNGPNVSGYCFKTNGIYECKDYWIWNCITEVN